MSKVLTFSRVFPAYHPNKGQPTNFVEKIYNGLYSKNNLMDYPLGLDIDDTVKGMKHHTIRAGNRWKVGDKFSPRVWSGKPYNSKQIIIAPDIEVKKVWNVVVEKNIVRNEDQSTTVITKISIDGKHQTSNYEKLASNDGLTVDELCQWFNKPMVGQIICWSKDVNYD